jgi:hypothetical protein
VDRGFDTSADLDIYREDMHGVRDSDKMFRVVLETCLVNNAILDNTWIL